MNEKKQEFHIYSDIYNTRLEGTAACSEPHTDMKAYVMMSLRIKCICGARHSLTQRFSKRHTTLLIHFCQSSGIKEGRKVGRDCSGHSPVNLGPLEGAGEVVERFAGHILRHQVGQAEVIDDDLRPIRGGVVVSLKDAQVKGHEKIE